MGAQDGGGGRFYDDLHVNTNKSLASLNLLSKISISR